MPQLPTANFSSADLNSLATLWNSAYGENVSGTDIGDWLNASGMEEMREAVRGAQAEPFACSGQGGDHLSSSDLDALAAAVLTALAVSLSTVATGYLDGDEVNAGKTRKLIRAVM